MEPFFISCSLLVVYCGYLTVSDLLRYWRKGSGTSQSDRRVVERAVQMVLTGQRLAATKHHLYGVTGKFPTFSRS